MRKESTYNNLPKFNSLDDLYIIAYTIEAGNEEANKYIKKIDEIEKGIEETYKDGKTMWDRKICSKFKMAIFKKKTDELIISFRPDMNNFEYESSKTYISDLKKEIMENYKVLSENETNYNFYKKEEMLVKRQINEKCLINKCSLLFERDYLKQEKERIFFDIITNIRKFGQPEYINSIFGNCVIGDFTILGEKEDIKSYIRVQIATANETFNTDLFEESKVQVQKYIDNWKKALEEVNKIEEEGVIVLKKKGKIFRTIDIKEEVGELQHLLNMIEITQNNEKTEEESNQMQEETI